MKLSFFFNIFKSYLAYAKGALNRDHMLILPIGHIQSTVKANDETLEDINAFKDALIKYFKSVNKGVVFFERNFKTHHLQIQVIRRNSFLVFSKFTKNQLKVFAVPNDKVFLLKDAFTSLAEQQGIELNEIPAFSDLKQILSPNQPYFYLELPEKEGRFLCEIRGSFPINYGRYIVFIKDFYFAK